MGALERILPNDETEVRKPFTRMKACAAIPNLLEGLSLTEQNKALKAMKKELIEQRKEEIAKLEERVNALKASLMDLEKI